MENLRANASSHRLIQGIEYSKLGWPILPLHTITKKGLCSCQRIGCHSVAKHPHTEHGSKDATLDPALICEWWSRWPEANIGIATGTASGLIVVDIDPRHRGDAAWTDFARQHDLPASSNVLTGGGGRHIYYRAPGKLIPNKTNLLPGVDIRGEGGYVVAPPSIHASGQIYKWERAPNVNEILPLPEALEDLILNPKAALVAPSADGVYDNQRSYEPIVTHLSQLSPRSLSDICLLEP